MLGFSTESLFAAFFENCVDCNGIFPVNLYVRFGFCHLDRILDDAVFRITIARLDKG